MKMHLFLVSVALAASFVPEILSYSQLKPKDVLMHELSQCEGIPKLTDATFPPWVDQVIATKVPVSEPVARWVMLNFFDNSSSARFFNYIMDNFGYASLVKDRVDYCHDPDKGLLFANYLYRHRLRHFPHLPAPLQKATNEMAFGKYVPPVEYILPLLSDHSINHPLIYDSILRNHCRHNKSFYKWSLICHCLGGVKLDPAMPFVRIYDLSIIYEVFQEFPEQMSAFVAGMKADAKDFFEIIRSRQPPMIEVWQRLAGHIFTEIHHDDFEGRLKEDEVALFHDLIHYLHQFHPAWMEEHLLDLHSDARIKYFLYHPEDFQPHALPHEMPSPNVLYLREPSICTIPVFQAMVVKHGLKSVIEVAKKNKYSRVHQLIRLSDPQIQEISVNRSFNKFITTLFYILGYCLWNDEFISWLAKLLISKDPTTWVPFGM